MNYQKLDAGLIDALEEQGEEPRRLPVFLQVRAELTAEERGAVEAIAGASYSPGRRIFTAALDPTEIAALSESTWVESIQLSQVRNLLTEEGES